MSATVAVPWLTQVKSPLAGGVMRLKRHHVPSETVVLMHQAFGRQIEPPRLPGRIAAGDRAGAELLDVPLGQGTGRQDVEDGSVGDRGWRPTFLPAPA